ncbi:hypothetical protein ACSBR2_019416 [Camellia fascicularis]
MMMMIHSSSHQVSLSWLDLKVFYVGITKCEVDDSTPRYLTLNHIPLHPNTLLEVNGARTSTYPRGVSSLLKRDRLDKKSKEVTFVCTNSIRVTQSVKFEVFDKDIRILSGVLELCTSDGCIGGLENHGRRWSMNCESKMDAGTRPNCRTTLKLLCYCLFVSLVCPSIPNKPNTSQEWDSPRIEVYVANYFDGTSIILTKTMQLSLRKKQMRTGILDSIPEYDPAKSQEDVPSRLNLQLSDYPNYNPENNDFDNLYTGTEYLEGEDGERSWFNAGVRVGVGIGLSICVGIGIGVGLLAQTYQGTARNFRRRLL